MEFDITLKWITLIVQITDAFNVKYQSLKLSILALLKLKRLNDLRFILC